MKAFSDNKKKLVVLVVLDGWGVAPARAGNAIERAKKPNFDYLKGKFLYTELSASGADVGLKDSEPGNSEAGHENMGAGRTVVQDKLLISESIRDETFFKNAAFVESLNHAKRNKSKVHLMGLLSDERSGHMEPEHLEALLLFFKKRKFSRVYLHLFTDGRDTPSHSAEKFIKRLLLAISSIGVGTIASLSGRYYAMDRAHNYGRLWRAYEAMVYGRGKIAKTPYQALQAAYDRGETDEFVSPTVIPATTKSGKTAPVVIAESDAVIFFNLRSDRARQMTRAFLQPELIEAESAQATDFKKFRNLLFVTVTEYGTEFPALIAYPTRLVYNALPAYLEKFSDIHQFYASESEKFAHVTYFFHGNTNRLFLNEKRVRVDSKKVATFDLAPEMSASELTAVLVEHIQAGLYNFCLVNYPNSDMLAHTGDIKATIRGVEAVDRQLGRVWEAVKKANGTLVITGDHGNAEEMVDNVTAEKCHEHTRNPVPFIIASESLRRIARPLPRGSLRDVAPTILGLLGIPQPPEMTGVDLLGGRELPLAPSSAPTS